MIQKINKDIPRGRELKRRFFLFKYSLSMISKNIDKAAKLTLIANKKTSFGNDMVTLLLRALMIMSSRMNYILLFGCLCCR